MKSKYVAIDDPLLYRAPNCELCFEGALTIRLIEHWGMVAGADGKEDSQGRAYIKLQTPGEVVTRAIEVARLAVSQMEAEGWIEPPKPHQKKTEVKPS